MAKLSRAVERYTSKTDLGQFSKPLFLLVRYGRLRSGSREFIRWAA
ncbi:MAG: hypothetical protein SFY66_03570 [Oculatellaceae cyanobacterium bins.114]|nr:hypothetical protein [Oculatellaceae cyanobacterium bins.114]